ncbi:mannitol dehydrogenase family protein [Plantibacter sp. Mn2098]|uniref:mannitol dehydrogenase family protein n=1 Tax=Plantibacter sp. Mn2098 TaxID=3395266 RepID=UPI003BBA8007
MTAVNSSNLTELGRSVAVPEYDRARVRPGIVHIGVGAFHRAHEAMYIDRLLQLGETEWGICGVGVLPTDARMRDVLAEQDALYTLVTKDPAGGDDVRVIGSIVRYAFAPDDPEAVLGLLASDTTRIVSLTITEGGYLVSETGGFELGAPGIAADLVPGAVPATVFGLLTEALRRRRVGGVPPFTVMSCDNIPGNGAVARTALSSFARAKDPELGEWVAENVVFPNSMVDRITPGTTPEAIAKLSTRHGVDDAWPVVSESFEQWVLEDRFTLGRPDFGAVGVQLVPDVAPYESMKLRLLNASHQAMSYLGILAGFTFVHELARDQRFVTFLLDYMSYEAIPTLDPVPGIDLASYRTQLIERFSNTAIADTLARQVVDGSERIPKFLLPVLRQQLAVGGRIDHIALVVAAWSVYLEGATESGTRIVVDDVRSSELAAAVQLEASTPGALLDLRAVFGELGSDERFRAAYVSARASIGAAGAVGAMLALRNGAPK